MSTPRARTAVPSLGTDSVYDLRGLAETAKKRRESEEQHDHYQRQRRWGATTREEPTSAAVLRAEATLLALISIAESLARAEADRG